MVVEYRQAGGPWCSWPEEIGDYEPEGRKAFSRICKRRHDPARMQFRPIRGTAVITDEILAE